MTLRDEFRGLKSMVKALEAKLIHLPVGAPPVTDPSPILTAPVPLHGPSTTTNTSAQTDPMPYSSKASQLQTMQSSTALVPCKLLCQEGFVTQKPYFVGYP
mgnify:CR=1 FL=1